MNKTEKINFIREKAIEANPSILDLKFRCELLRKGKENRNYKVIEDVGFAGNDKKVWINSVPFGSMPLELEKDLVQNGGEFVILGRPIGLADILLAIKHKYIKGTLQKEGELKNGTEWLGEISWDWNLKQDNLELQEEATIDFIYNLLINK